MISGDDKVKQDERKDILADKGFEIISSQEPYKILIQSLKVFVH
jgi:hypothetical protein